MNANELAEALEDWDNDGQWDELAATMLRQQQAEIESLKTKLAYMFEQELKSTGVYK